MQFDDNANVYGTATVRKQTAPMFNYYEYTYWSSPVSGETIADGLTYSDPTRRFSFEAGNFKDSFQETNNNNVLVPGHDDIDDNNDDWQFTPATTIMTPGLGFASHHEESFCSFSHRHKLFHIALSIRLMGHLTMGLYPFPF